MNSSFTSRWLLISLGHAAALFLLFWIGFAYGMGSFTSASSGDTAAGISSLATLIDLPAFVIQKLRPTTDPLTFNNYLFQRGFLSPVSFVWSIIFGGIVAYFYPRFARQPSRRERNKA